MTARSRNPRPSGRGGRQTGNSEDGWDYAETDGTQTADWSDEDVAQFVTDQAAWLTA